MSYPDPQIFDAQLKRYLDGELSAAEAEQFLQQLAEDQHVNALSQSLQQALGNNDYRGLSDPAREEIVFTQIMNAAGNTKLRQLKHIWYSVAAAAILILAVAGVYQLTKKEPVKAAMGVASLQHDLPPGGDKATLTLADGSTVLLDDKGNRLINDRAGAADIMQQKGQLQYKGVTDNSTNGNTIAFNTLTTPKGGKYMILLADGTKVWLNAASSLRYPTAFQGKQRLVELSGEAYFEVANNRSMPFLVTVNKQNTVEVLGTSFNINAYADEAAERTTLLAGAVKVTAAAGSSLLQPGQQAQVTTGKAIRVLDKVNTRQTVAWKDGVFDFQDRKLADVMRQLSRWYNIEVVYEKGIPDIEFFGEMGTNLNLSQALKMLEKAGVKFRMEGQRKLVVVPS